MATFENVSLGTKLLTAGTSACIADALTFPLDTAKVRLQVINLINKNNFKTKKNIFYLRFKEKFALYYKMAL